MLRLLVDQDFDHDILRGLRERVSELDAVTAHQLGLSRAPDPDLLLIAVQHEQRIIITHDRRTMPGHADLMEAGYNIAGVIIVPRDRPIGQIIYELEIIVSCSEAHEWQNRIEFLPMFD